MRRINIELAMKLLQKRSMEENEVIQIVSEDFLLEFEKMQKTIHDKIGGKHFNRDIYMYFYQFRFFL